MSASFSEALSLWQAGRLAEARQACLAILEQQPENVAAVNLLAVQCGLPVVSVQGAFMRGRFGSGILDSVGLAEWVAADDTGLVRRAVRLGGDRVLRRSVSEQMRRRGQRLFCDRSSTETLESVLWQAVWI
ncbi:MAG TPA: hypothetical protein VMU40_06740 [Steroidobacteraceae bacterium]|nr:hypothetical protein [Steroidobacteraceae bacterium]